MPGTNELKTKIRTLYMKRVLLFSAAIILVLLVSFTGCTGTSEVPVETTVPTVMTTLPTTIVTPVQTSTPEPVVTLPPNQVIYLDLSKDRTYSTITLIYNGGGGEMFTTKIEMKVTGSDGQVKDYAMNSGAKPKRGDTIEAQGTRGSDRCEVWVTSAGTRYKVIDQSLILGGAYEGN